MFCPTCGKENPAERKFCSSCGTNLEAVSQVLSGTATNVFTRIDTGLDFFLARYADHIFKDASTEAADRKVGNSWRILGKGVATSLVDIFLAVLIWNVLVFRFHILWISTPFRLLSERSRRQKNPDARVTGSPPLRLPEPEQRWIAGEGPGISEHTTERLQQYEPVHRDRSSAGE